jgi:hypothetical protein
MFTIDWFQIGLGFTVGVIASYYVCDLVFPPRKY